MAWDPSGVRLPPRPAPSSPRFAIARVSRAAAAAVAIAVVSRAYSVALILVIASPAGVHWPLLSTERSPFVAWDGQWYLSIARTGYHVAALQAQHHDYAFFPVWPLLIRVSSLGVLPQEIVAPLLANLLFIAAAPAVVACLTPRFGASAALLGFALIAFAPPAYVFSMGYSESLFLVVAALLILDGGRSWRSPVLGAVGGATRVAGLGLAAAGAALTMTTGAARWRRGGAIAAATAVGFGAWWAYVAFLTGDPLGLVHGVAGWQQSSGLVAIARALRAGELPGLADIGFVALVGVGALGLLRLQRDLAAYSLVVLGLAVFFGRLSSDPRYALLAFPAFALLARSAGRRGTIALLAAFIVGQWLFVTLTFASGAATPPP
jgi:hypothetical protein